MSNRREHIQAPYKAHNGAVLNERQCQEYNTIQDDINRWIDAGRKPPEWLLDHSFRTFNLLCAIAKGDYKHAKDRR
jgi:hypothetical protein